MLLVKTHNKAYETGWNAHMAGRKVEDMLRAIFFTKEATAFDKMAVRYDMLAGYAGAVNFNDKRSRNELL